MIFFIKFNSFFFGKIGPRCNYSQIILQIKIIQNIAHCKIVYSIFLKIYFFGNIFDVHDVVIFIIIY